MALPRILGQPHDFLIESSSLAATFTGRNYHQLSLPTATDRERHIGPPLSLLSTYFIGSQRPPRVTSFQLEALPVEIVNYRLTRDKLSQDCIFGCVLFHSQFGSILFLHIELRVDGFIFIFLLWL